MKFFAQALVAAGLLCLAAPLLSRAANASQPRTYQDLVSEGRQLAQNGNDLAAFIDYYEANNQNPIGEEAKDALVKQLHDGLPVRIPQAVIDPTIATGALQVSTSLNGQVLEVTARDGEIAPVNDPQNNWPFTRVTYFYRQSKQPTGDWVCYCAVHCQLADDQDLADRMGRLLFVIRAALVEKTGYVPLTDGEPFGVWLCRHATGGNGDQEWHNNIYFFDVTTQRSSIEWIREVAHEFSHLGLPAIGGDYTDPEAWANGYYGERLLLRWLHRGAAGGRPAVEAAWGGTFAGYVNFDKLLIEPYLDDFNHFGISRTQLALKNGAGMEYLIGMLLAVDDHAGPKVVADMLWSLPQTAQVDPLLLYSPAVDALAGPAVPKFVEPVDASAPAAAPAHGPAQATPKAPASGTKSADSRQ